MSALNHSRLSTRESADDSIRIVGVTDAEFQKCV